MKKAVLALSITTVLAASVAQAEVTLYDYKEASSAYEEAYISGSLNLGKSRGDEQTAYDVDVDAYYDRTISTPSRDINYGGDITGTVSRSGAKDADSVDSYTASAGASIDTYFQPGSSGAFWFGGVAVAGRDFLDDDENSNNLQTAATVGAGYGRVTNVTPMARAIRLVDELVKRNVLRAKPSIAVYQELAKLIARESEYASRYGASDYELNWIGDVEGILARSGVLSSLGAKGALKVRDVLLEENVFTRRLGWKVRAGVTYVGENFDGLTDEPALTLQGEYHRPLSNQTQFSNIANLLTILNSDDDSYTFRNVMTLTHEIDDRIDWNNGWTLDYVKGTGVDNDATTNTLSSGFDYEISNSLDFYTKAQLVNVDGTSTDGTDRSLKMGVTYRLR